MKEMFTEQMLQEIFDALERGETYGHSDGNTSIQVSPNSISIRYNSMPTNKDTEVSEFLSFCDRLDDDLFNEACESFSERELTSLQGALDTDDYKNTIKVFTTRVREIANNNLTKIINETDVEIRHQEAIIKEAQATIDELHHLLDEAYNKYTI